MTTTQVRWTFASALIAGACTALLCAAFLGEVVWLSAAFAAVLSAVVSAARYIHQNRRLRGHR